MAGHTMLGYVLAVGIKGAGSGERLLPALGALLIWVILLNGGTLAINSVFDRDEGDIGYLNAPPPLPRHLLAFSGALLAGGQLLAFALPPAFRVAYAICFVLSILYSVPPRSEEHTSELQSQSNLVCRLLLEKKKKSRTRRTLPRPSRSATSL